MTIHRILQPRAGDKCHQFLWCGVTSDNHNVTPTASDIEAPYAPTRQAPEVEPSVKGRAEPLQPGVVRADEMCAGSSGSPIAAKSQPLTAAPCFPSRYLPMTTKRPRVLRDGATFFTMRMPESLRAAIERIAEREERSVGWIVRKAIEQRVRADGELTAA